MSTTPSAEGTAAPLREAPHRRDRARRAQRQAGQSALIENYLGFPNGLSGADLSHRALTQAQRLGAEMVFASAVEALEQRGNIHAVRFADGTEVEARAVVIATGLAYRLMAADGLAELTGRGVYHGASASDAPGTAGEDVYIKPAPRRMRAWPSLGTQRVRTSLVADSVAVRISATKTRGGY